MKILALLRMVPSPASELELTEDHSDIDREWLDFQLNDFDDQALEEAILLKEAVGARVVAVAVGEGSKRVLQMAVARGADEAVIIPWDPDSMIATPALAPTLAAFARDEAFDLVLAGVQSPEDLFGQACPYIGGLLRWPHLSGTSRIAADEGGLRVDQERGGGATATYSVKLPAVLGVQTSTKPPRYVSGTKLREASKLMPTVLARLDAEQPLSVRTFALPERGTAENLGSSAEAVADAIAVLLEREGLLPGVES